MKRAIAALFCAALILSACGKDEPSSGPPEIAYGEAVCSRCGMILSEPRFAAALRVAEPGGGTRLRIYDDVGELFLDLAAPQPPEPVEVWVHDAVTEKWIDGRGASYVRGEIRTPMGLGVEAHADRATAHRRAWEAKGETMDFKALKEAAASGYLHSNSKESP